MGSNPTLSERRVPIAQLDRALDCGSKGRRFESSWARREQGEMRERLNRAVSKTVVDVSSTEGSNPSLSVTGVPENFTNKRAGRRNSQGNLRPVLRRTGEMTEWPKVHAWKACVLVRVPRVRIPLSPIPPLVMKVRSYAISTAPKSVRTGR